MDMVIVSGVRGHSKCNSSAAQASNKENQFPGKLYELLEAVDDLGLSHVVSWLPGGRSFRVKDPTQFMDLVVPQFFNAKKYRSFQRQLNLWDFHKIVNGQDNGGCWSHESFIRGNPKMISKMTRTRIKCKMTQTLLEDEDSSERVNEYNEEDINYDDSGRHICNSMRRHVVPGPRKDEVFDETMFSESVDLTMIEPLPVHSAGILDGPCDTNSSELAEFGQLLNHLM